MDEFSDMHIDQDHESEEIPHADIFMNKIVDHHIVQLPNNHIPKGLVPLERLFDINDVVVKIMLRFNKKILVKIMHLHYDGASGYF